MSADAIPPGRAPRTWQMRAARGALQWSQRRLAEASGVHYMTVARFERELRVAPATVVRMRKALEGVGVVFTRDGVVLRPEPGR